MARQQPFSVDLGETWAIMLSCKNADGSTMSLDPASVAQFELGVGNPHLLVTGIISDAPGGVVRFTVSPAAQTGIQPGSYPHLTRVTLPDGTVTHQTIGQVQVIRPL